APRELPDTTQRPHQSQAQRRQGPLPAEDHHLLHHGPRNPGGHSHHPESRRENLGPGGSTDSRDSPGAKADNHAASTTTDEALAVLMVEHVAGSSFAQPVLPVGSWMHVQGSLPDSPDHR